MNILVVTAHPLKKSLCSNLAELIIGELKKSGHEIVVEDLYENHFNPVLSIDERQSYYATPYHASDVASELKRLKDAEGLVLVFPTWWFGFPAILKGWFDRVWAPGEAYRHADDLGPIRPQLNRLKKAFVVTTLGAPWWVDYFILRRPVKRIIRLALLGACAKNCNLTYLSFYKCEKVSYMRVRTIKKKIQSALIKWVR